MEGRRPAPSVRPSLQVTADPICVRNPMPSLHPQFAETLTPTGKTLLQRQIDTNDHHIDALAYELYGLTEEEMRLVEGQVRAGYS